MRAFSTLFAWSLLPTESQILTRRVNRWIELFQGIIGDNKDQVHSYYLVILRSAVWSQNGIPSKGRRHGLYHSYHWDTHASCCGDDDDDDEHIYDEHDDDDDDDDDDDEHNNDEHDDDDDDDDDDNNDDDDEFWMLLWRWIW